MRKFVRSENVPSFEAHTFGDYMEFFNRFAWAVPHAFREALNNCRFEEGDILYEDRKAYEGDWKNSQYSLQVVFPPRSSGGNQNFASNWESPVQFDFFRFGDDKRRIESTQGRLYWMLWKGEVGAFDVPAPTPFVVRDIPKEAVSVESLVGVSPKAPFFVMPVDHTSELLRMKKHHIQIATRKHLPNGEPRVIDLNDIGISNWEQFAPTIELVLFETPDLSKEKLHDLIKSVVYKPVKDAKKDMFRINAHGWLFGKEHYAGTTLFG